MTRTTRAPRFKVAALFPEIAGLAKRTVRLHPRPGPEPAVNASKLGGRFLWPAGEAWPVCTEQEWRREDDNPPPHEHLYVPVLQLRQDDVPELPFPDGADLFQLLWCPNDHERSLSPVCKSFWRREADVAEPLTRMRKPAPVEQEYLPRPCRLYPERVTEYPGQDELPDSLEEAVQRWEVESEEEGSYFFELSTAPGTKLGGYVHWIQGQWIPDCVCGHPMEHLLTVASGEFMGASWQRWCPIEDVQATGMTLDELQAGNAWLDALIDVDRSTGIMLGDGGSL